MSRRRGLKVSEKPEGGNSGETMTEIRVPECMVEDIARFVAEKGYRIPLFQSRVAAGFPSPADDYIEARLDLNEHLIKNPAATFFARATGESMTGVGIFPGDILVVDRSLSPKNGSIIIAVVDGELAVKRLSMYQGRVELVSENPRYKPIVIPDEASLEVWGVVSYVIHSLR